ncbi:sugar phosphate isomerase/epimerase family protein [Oribacterium sinus]|uniref:sugar phosphate isomerase/epimerase family protein n=1 Tax=Oribacterium sinus TaxID=237576 RepID=UPI0028D34DD0|nr:sugar phosphate isomerase/epimerase family protein [Oribacterium sinus]
MKLCISNIAWKKSEDKQMYHMCSEMGYEGIEIAPTRIFPNNPYDYLHEAKVWAHNLNEEYGLKIFSCQSIWYGRTENIFASKKEREALIEYTKKALAFAAVIGARSIVFGCPKNRNGFKKSPHENSKISTEFFNKLADVASEYRVTISIEANPVIYGSDFLNSTEETIDFITQLDREYIRLNLDIGTMLYNQERADCIKGYEKMISHIHISEPLLYKIEERKEHEEIFDILKMVGYNKAISIEMKQQDRIEEISKIMQYIQSVFKPNFRKI